MVIVQADKGGAIMILDGDHYKRMVEEVFYDPEYFEDSDGNQMTETLNKIAALCRKHRSCLTTDEISYLSKFDCKEANFYVLPKAHKSKLIKDAIHTQNSEVIEIYQPQDLKVRPIIGGPISPTSHLSQLIDFLLQPFVLQLPSYTRDSMDLLRQELSWEKDEKEEYDLITMDIINMFMNVSESLGVKSVTHFVTKKPELLHPRFSLEFLVDAILLVLRNNVSFFDGKYRRQIHGCAMGSHKSPPYSSLSIGYLEDLLHERSKISFSEDYANYLRTMLRRFLDDIFMKWRRSLGDPKELLKVMNSLDPKIKFTMEIGKTLPFLDVRFTMNTDNSLSTDIFYKETDTHNYVPFYSFHPHKTLTNIPYSLARRICTIVSNSNSQDRRLSELRGFLRSKQYPETENQKVFISTFLNVGKVSFLWFLFTKYGHLIGAMQQY
jgi:hypothetical protein